MRDNASKISAEKERRGREEADEVIKRNIISF